MDNDTKDLLMQYLQRFAEHFEIQDTHLSFRKRNELLENLKEKNHEAWSVIDALFNAFVKFDRIGNDKEKYDRLIS